MRIRTTEFKDDKSNRKYFVKEYEDFEYVNPILHVMTLFIEATISFEKKMLQMNGFNAFDNLTGEILFKRATQQWTDKYKKYKAIKLPENLIGILDTNKKKEQIHLLKGISLTSDELIAFFFKAYEDYGYKFSQYKAEHHHEGLDVSELPELIHVDENNKIDTIGETKLTEGQQRQVVEHRKVTVSKFLDNDEKWHCFFLTFKSLNGKEQYKDGQPHLHYISNAWNIPREEVKKQLTCKNYSLPSLPHVDFHTHRNPRNEQK